MNYYGFVYLTTNKINGKQYVGKRTFSNGWEKYLGSGKHIKNAINKYGKENFSKEILEKCLTLKELNECEKKWINHFNAVENDNFYNIATGGDGGKTWKIHPMLGKKLSKASIQKRTKNRMYNTGTNHHRSSEVEYINTGQIGCLHEIEKISGVNNLSKFLSENNGYYVYKNGKHKGKEFRYTNTTITQSMKNEQKINKISKSLIGQKRHSKKILYVNENIIMCGVDMAKHCNIGYSFLMNKLKTNNGHYVFKHGKHKGKEFKYRF